MLELDIDTLLAVAHSFPCFMLRKAKSLCDACVLNFVATSLPSRHPCTGEETITGVTSFFFPKLPACALIYH